MFFPKIFHGILHHVHRWVLCFLMKENSIRSVFWWKKKAFAAKELITLVYKTSLGMTRLLSTQHHTLGPLYSGVAVWTGKINRMQKRRLVRWPVKMRWRMCFHFFMAQSNIFDICWRKKLLKSWDVLGGPPWGFLQKRGIPKTHVVNSQLATSIPKHGVMTWNDGPGYPYFSCSLHNQ